MNCCLVDLCLTLSNELQQSPLLKGCQLFHSLQTNELLNNYDKKQSFKNSYFYLIILFLKRKKQSKTIYIAYKPCWLDIGLLSAVRKKEELIKIDRDTRLLSKKNYQGPQGS